MNTNLTLIHYGNSVFDASLFQPIQDSTTGFNKPRGGLWASPIKSKYGWREWCEMENFRVESLKSFFKFLFVGRVLIIDKFEDIKKLHWDRKRAFYRPYFEPLLSDYDAIHLTENGERETRFSLGYTLYGWDCESVLVLNKDCIKLI